MDGAMMVRGKSIETLQGSSETVVNVVRKKKN